MSEYFKNIFPFYTFLERCSFLFPIFISCILNMNLSREHVQNELQLRIFFGEKNSDSKEI